MAMQKQDDRHEHTFSSYVRIRDVVLKTYLGRWTIGRSGERGSGISVLPARYDDDDDDMRLPPIFFYSAQERIGLRNSNMNISTQKNVNKHIRSILGLLNDDKIKWIFVKKKNNVIFHLKEINPKAEEIWDKSILSEMIFIPSLIYTNKAGSILDKKNMIIHIWM